MLKSAANEFRDNITILRGELEQERRRAVQRAAEPPLPPPQDPSPAPASAATAVPPPADAMGEAVPREGAEPALSSKRLSLSEQICDLQSRIDSELASRRQHTEPSLPSQGAVTDAAGKSPLQLQITVPQGAAPGMELEFEVDGQPMSLVIPPGHWPGDVFCVEIAQ